MPNVTKQAQPGQIDLTVGLSEKELDLHPFCNTCGWRKGGLDSWNGRACKCGHYESSFRMQFALVVEAQKS